MGQRRGSAVMVSALISIMRLLVGRRHDMTCPRWLAVLATTTFALYQGWSSIAVFANTATELISSGVSASVTWWQLVVLVAAAVFAWGWRRCCAAIRNTVAGALWALVSIAIGAAGRGKYGVGGDGRHGRLGRGGHGGRAWPRPSAAAKLHKGSAFTRRSIPLPLQWSIRIA